jgi:hypothetical protein
MNMLITDFAICLQEDILKTLEGKGIVLETERDTVMVDDIYTFAIIYQYPQMYFYIFVDCAYEMYCRAGYEAVLQNTCKYLQNVITGNSVKADSYIRNCDTDMVTSYEDAYKVIGKSEDDEDQQKYRNALYGYIQSQLSEFSYAQTA